MGDNAAMSEKLISELGKETLKWIQREQKTNGVGMVKFASVPNQNALRYLLRIGDVFEPQEGMIKSSVEAENEELGSSTLPDHKPWVWRTPKPKSKNDHPEPYEFLPYPDWSVLPNAVAEALRPIGFADAPCLHEGYSYRKMAGGALRRKMVGTHSKEAMLAELKFRENRSEAEWAKFEEDLDDKIADYKGKSKQFPEVEICQSVVYYPKDGSFSFIKKKGNRRPDATAEQ
jgi:hypothetical protein